MCGIAGLWTQPGSQDSNDVAGRMAGCIVHRGPDDSGVWSDPDAGISLSHRRLSIVDLSAEGHQPKASASGRFIITYNGEVYNFAELRRELEARGAHFRGASDTEVILTAIETWGVHAAVGRFVGMFAFVLWDRGTRTLHLVRDRLGIKPLFVARIGRALAFASEARAFRHVPGFAGDVDRDALTLLLRHNCIPAPYSIYTGVRKLMPGTILSLSRPDDDADAVTYWSARDVAARGMANPFEGSPEEAVDALEAQLRDAVRLRMVADVPLGAFLSGGVDSSTVVALMQAQSDRAVRTFSIGSPDAAYDEAADAALVARHLGTEHTSLVVTDADALEVVPRLGDLMDEPFADSSLIPTYLVSALARQHVTVSLSGDGGDELFAGYNRHVWGGRIDGLNRRVPQPLLRAFAGGLTAARASTWDAIYGRLEPLVPARLRQRMVGYKLHRIAGLLDADSPETLYHRLTSHWTDPSAVVRDGAEPPTAITRHAEMPALDFTGRMMLLDLITYLPDDILTKVDRASMAVSLEARVPILDHRVVELAWRMPPAYRLRDGESKWLIRQVLYRHVPRELIDRPKMGFGIPIEAWLRGPLRDWAESLLDERRLRDEGWLDPAPVRRMWREHLEGRASWQYHLWDVLMFQAWSESVATGGAVHAPAAAAV